MYDMKNTDCNDNESFNNSNYSRKLSESHKSGIKPKVKSGWLRSVIFKHLTV